VPNTLFYSKILKFNLTLKQLKSKNRKLAKECINQVGTHSIPKDIFEITSLSNSVTVMDVFIGKMLKNARVTVKSFEYL